MPLDLALAAASNRTLLLVTADSLVEVPCGKRTQYVQYSVCAPARSVVSAAGLVKSSGRVSMSPSPGALRGCPVSVRTWCPAARSSPAMAAPE
jgi:hypothetical protein